MIKTKLCAQQDSTDTQLFALPVIFNSPETRLGFGALVSLTHRFNALDTISPPSNIQVAGAYTQNQQLLFYLPYQVYWNQRKWTARGELGYYRYTYLYFGVGDEDDSGWGAL